MTMKYVIVLLAVVLMTDCFGQKKVASVAIKNTVSYAAVDRPGDLYVITANGEAMKFDKNGKEIGKKKFSSVPTIFDPKDGTRAFAYFRDTQTIESIAPDLSSSETFPLHPEFAVSAWLVCPSKNELWVLDAADITLKKTKEKGTAIAYETSYGEKDVKQIQYMREYLNFLFVLDNGIHILNNLGKEIHTIDANAQFSFLGEEIYYVSGNTLTLIDLYNTEKREIALPHTAAFALLTDDRLILVQEGMIEFFEFTP
jgi:hypothetical protein